MFDQISEEQIEFESHTKEVSEEQNRLKNLLGMSVNEIELSVRAANCLNNANITTVGELATKSEPEMLKYRNNVQKLVVNALQVDADVQVYFYQMEKYIKLKNQLPVWRELMRPQL